MRETVLVEREVEKALFAVPVMVKREGAALAPCFHTLGREQMMAGLGEHHGGGQQHESGHCHSGAVFHLHGQPDPPVLLVFRAEARGCDHGQRSA